MPGVGCPAPKGLQIGSTVLSLLRSLSVLLVGAAAIAIFFRAQIATQFQVAFGDRGDGLIEVAILEHWWNVLRGMTLWRNPLFFYPVKDTLGFNDGYLAYGIIYSAFRSFDFDPILASESTNICIKALGFLGCFVFLRYDLRRPHWIALTYASVFTISNNTYVNAYHAQLMSVSFVPWFTLVSFRLSLSVASERRLAIVAWGFAAASLTAIWLLTAFYTIWFTLFLGATMVFVFAVRLPLDVFRSQVSSLWREFLPVSISIAFLLFALIPFVLVYFQTSVETGMHPLSEALLYTPSPIDILNVGPKNLIFGGLDYRLAGYFGADFPLTGELVMGIPPVLLVLSVSGISVCARGDTLKHRWLFALGTAAILSWLVTIHIGEWSAWELVFQIVPGAKAVRAISRLDIVLMFPCVLLASEVATKIWDFACVRNVSSSRMLCRMTLATMGVALVVEEVNLAGPLGLSRPAENHLIAAVTAPPKTCASFYAVSEQPGPPLGTPNVDAAYSNNVDAMFIAEVKGLPTLNGMASFYPSGWDLTRPRAVDYQRRVTAWIGRHHLRRVCSLDLGNGVWNDAATNP